MTLPLDPDRHQQKPPLLPFDRDDLDRCGIRMNRAEFSRFLGVSKQAVSEWTRAGKLTLGADGLLDPRQAVAQLMRTTDPARLRSKVLAPLVRDVGLLQKQAASLAAQLAEAKEEAGFHEGASVELIHQMDALHRQLRSEWCDLRLLPAPQGIAALDAWIAEAAEAGGDPDIEIMDCVVTTVDALAASTLADVDSFPAPASPLEGGGKIP